MAPEVGVQGPNPSKAFHTPSFRTRTTRNPKNWSRPSGSYLLRYADRQYLPSLNQLPPRSTRAEAIPDGISSILPTLTIRFTTTFLARGTEAVEVRKYPLSVRADRTPVP